MPPQPIPRILIAGTHSGVGKTTVAMALTQALGDRGLTVSTFKCGPDYLDLTHHRQTSGRPCHSLDGWLMGRDAVLSTFHRGSAGADAAVIEGMMGLFDGATAESEVGSSAEIAKWLGAPVLVVLDASAMARTIAALGHGLAGFDSELNVLGLFANRVGGPAHLKLLQNATMNRPAPVFGGLPKEPSRSLPERHLGLHAALGLSDLPAWGPLFAQWNDLDLLWSAMKRAPALGAPLPATAPRLGTCRIAVAWDAAFHFYYEDNLEQLRRLGAELVFFSPLTAQTLPHDIDGLFLGGGYPELYAETLGANQTLKNAIAAFSGTGAPIYAECGGLMYLCEAIRTVEGKLHRMVGLISGTAVVSETLQALGYVEVETLTETVLGPPGLRFRGHQFRYSSLQDGPGAAGALSVQRLSGETHREGHGPANVLASYVHAHWASNPSAPKGFVETALRFKARRR